MPPSLEKTSLLAEDLIDKFLNELAGPSATTTSLHDEYPPALPLLNDSARLLKAQVTKLSLLAINKPFTPTAISSVLNAIITSCLPALISTVQICNSQPSLYARFFTDEVRTRVRRVMREMLELLREVQSLKDGGERRRLDSDKHRDSLSATGVVWNGCDELIALATAGLSGLAVQKAEAYRDMVQDAIAELREWREGADLENEGQGDGLLDSEDEGVDGDRESLEDMFNAANSLPADREDLRALVLHAEEKLKKVVILYTALIKRRLRPLPQDSGGLDSQNGQTRLEEVMALLKIIPLKVDEFASELYDLDAGRADTCFSDLMLKAKDCADVARLSFQGREDEFTAWTAKWEAAVV